jgi:hypothetical protein
MRIIAALVVLFGLLLVTYCVLNVSASHSCAPTCTQVL